MSRRARVPRRKQLGSQHRKRNATPKLSPYQKEQKRDKLANQAPIQKVTRDFPASARRLQKFLSGGKQRRGSDDDRKVPLAAAAARVIAEAQTTTDRDGEASGGATAAASSSASTSAAAATTTTLAINASHNNAKNNQQGRRSAITTRVENLNRQLLQQPQTQDPAMLQRLERKAKATAKKREKRREERVQKIRAQSDAIDAVVAAHAGKSSGAKKKKRGDAGDGDDRDLAEKIQRAFEAARSTRRKKKTPQHRHGEDDDDDEAADGESDEGDHAEGGEDPQGEQRHQQQEEGLFELPPWAASSSLNASGYRHTVKSKATEEADKAGLPLRDFTDLVDVVRFGERADAPPSFDVLPMKNAALVPTQHVGKAKREQLVAEARREQIQRVMQHAGVVSASAAPAVSTTPLPGGDELVAPIVRNTRLESADDFAALRDRVMQRYAKKNQGSFFQRRKGAVFVERDGG